MVFTASRFPHATLYPNLITVQRGGVTLKKLEQFKTMSTKCAANTRSGDKCAIIAEKKTISQINHIYQRYFKIKYFQNENFPFSNYCLI